MNAEELIEALNEELNEYHPEFDYDERCGFESAIALVEDFLKPRIDESNGINQGYYVITNTIRDDVLFLKDLADTGETYDVTMSNDLREAVMFSELDNCVKLLELLEDGNLNIYRVELVEVAE